MNDLEHAFYRAEFRIAREWLDWLSHGDSAKETSRLVEVQYRLEAYEPCVNLFNTSVLGMQFV